MNLNQYPDIFDVPHLGGFAYHEWSAGDSGVKIFENVDVSQYNQLYLLITSFVPFDSHPTSALLETLLVNNTIDDITVSLNKILEKMILDSPNYWIWSHNRWK